MLPKDWEVGILSLIYKNERRECSNYRGITMLSILAKTKKSQYAAI